MKTARLYKERHLYYYTCSGCGKQRSTLKKKKQLIGVCTKCKRSEVSKNQISLFNASKFYGQDKEDITLKTITMLRRGVR